MIMACDESRTRLALDADIHNVYEASRICETADQSSSEVLKADNYDQTALDLSVSHRDVDTCTNKVASFVFFDTETTGLHDVGHNPKITEFCLLAVQRNELHPDSSQPRVINKLLMCLNPEKCITPSASMITGLFNDHLEKCEQFNAEMVRMMTSFIKCLPPPVCLVAHNGNGFDFPLLCSELKQLDESLPDSLLCADSLECFQQITSDKVAAEMRSDMVVMKQHDERTPLKRATVADDPPVVVKKPRKNPVMQDILYSGINKESATRRLNFDIPEQMECHSSRNEKTSLQPSEILTCGRIPIIQKSSVVKKLNFTDIENEDAVDAVKASDAVSETKCGSSFPINMPTPESSPDSKKPDVCCKVLTCGTVVAVGGKGEAKTETQVESEAKESSSYSRLSSSNSISDSEMLLAGEDAENKIKYNEYISDPQPVNIISAEECAVSDTLSNSESKSDSDVSDRKDKIMSEMLLPATKYSPLIISPTTRAQMRNENQQKSEDVAQGKGSPAKRGKALTTTTKSSPVKTFPCRLSFRLQEIYRRCYGRHPPTAHNAESDCITLLKVVLKHSPQFLEWVDKNAVPFNSISPMY